MAAWLKLGVDDIAFEHDVVPREALRTWITLETLEDRARQQADGILDDAAAAAGDIADKARADAAAVTRLGYAQGRRDGLRHWHAETLAQRAEATARHGSLREQLAGMVVQATARLVQGPVLAQYLAQALQALDDLAAQDLVLTVTVHPDDRETVQAAIDRMQTHWRDGCVVKIIEAGSAEPGTCRCESAQGYVDASLSAQLATLRQAAMGALAGLQLPDDIAEPPAPPVPVAAAAPAPGFDAFASAAGQAEQARYRPGVPMPFPEYGSAEFGADYDDDDAGFDDDEDDGDDGGGVGAGGLPGPAAAAAGRRPRW